MIRQVSVAELRTHLADLLGAVHDGNEPVIVEHNGKPFTVLISPEQYERYQGQIKEQFFEAVEEVQRLNAEEDPDDVLREVSSIVDNVRQERYDRRHQRPATGDH